MLHTDPALPCHRHTFPTVLYPSKGTGSDITPPSSALCPSYLKSNFTQTQKVSQMPQVSTASLLLCPSHTPGHSNPMLCPPPSCSLKPVLCTHTFLPDACCAHHPIPPPGPCCAHHPTAPQGMPMLSHSTFHPCSPKPMQSKISTFLPPAPNFFPPLHMLYYLLHFLSTFISQF